MMKLAPFYVAALLCLLASKGTDAHGRGTIRDVCDTCTADEVCRIRSGIRGCICLDGHRPNPGNFDAVETCASSTGTISLSRCQIFESGFSLGSLHLNDPRCRGTIENGRIQFSFDNENHICGTNLTTNSTHFIYQNAIQSNLNRHGHNVISRARWMNIAFSCAYPLIQTISMPMSIQAAAGVISQEIPGEGTYQIRMIPYHDEDFTYPFEGAVQIEVNQQIYVAVEVEGVDTSQIATVLDSCWATPENNTANDIRWSLITDECPSHGDGTVEILQNGNDTTSYFSFSMFTFTGRSDRIFLHCEVHLCLVSTGRCEKSCEVGSEHEYEHENERRRRSPSDFKHSARITMGL